MNKVLLAIIFILLSGGGFMLNDKASIKRFCDNLTEEMVELFEATLPD